MKKVRVLTAEEAALLVEYSADVRRRIEVGEEYMNEDMAFHSHIAKCSHNMVLKPLIPLIETAVLMIANITRQELLSATNETHDQIVNCILDRHVHAPGHEPHRHQPGV